jgi:Kef-type K+ transport system membrane component KefB
VELERDSLLVVLAVAALAPVLADLPARLRMPVVVAELTLGIVVGPQVLGLAERDALIDVLAEFGLAFLFFLAGMEVELDRIRGRLGAVAAGAWGVSLVIAVLVATGLWALDVVAGPVLVALALSTTALGALVPILKDSGLAGTPVGSRAMATGAAGEFGPVVGLSVVLAFESGEPWRTLLLVVFAVVAVATGWVALKVRPGRIVRLVEATMQSSGQLALRLSIVVLGGLVVLADDLGLDVVLGGFAAGLIVGQVARGEPSEPFRGKLEGIGYGFLIPIFFIGTGLSFNVDALFGDLAAVALVPVFAALFLLVRGVPTWFAYRVELPPDERGAVAVMSASALPLVVAITEIARERGAIDETDAMALVGAGMLSLLVFPVVGIRLATRATRS